MAKKTASRTSTKAKLNIDTSEVKISKSNKNKATRYAKNTSAKAWIFGIIFFIVGIGAGCGVWFGLSRNDTFELVGNADISLVITEKYEDTGVKIISFGKDASATISIETNLLVDQDGKYYAEEIGTYYIKYTTTDFKFGKLFNIEKVRLISFVEESEGVTNE